MAQKVKVLLVDDLSGGEADETVVFGIDGAQYEVDLNSENADKLRAILAQYVAAGRRQGGRVQRGKRGATAPRPAEDTAKIRAWAKENGYEVNDRGRVPATVVEAYHNAAA